jgi:hypothetical protein
MAGSTVRRVIPALEENQDTVGELAALGSLDAADHDYNPTRTTAIA